MPRVHNCAALLACSVMLLVLERPAHAEGDSLRLTRAQVQERAVGQSAEMVRRLAVRTQTRLLERESYPFNPEVSVEVTGTPAPWSGTDYARRIMLEQELDLRGERRARRSAGRAAAAVADREYGERAQAIAAEVDGIYSRHLVAQRRASLLAGLRDRARDLGAKAEHARGRETLSGFDARLLGSEAVSLEADWLGARNEADVTGAELRVWLELPRHTALAFEDDLGDGVWSCDADSAWVLARHTRLVVARVAAAESLALARVVVEERHARANPTLGASVSRERFELDTGEVGVIHDEGTSIGLHVRVPLSIFQRNATGITEARLDVERARVDRAALDREVRQEAVAACAALRGAEDERALRAVAAESAGRDLQLIEAAYEGGRIPLDEYLTLRERLVRQQTAWLESLGRVEAERSRLVRVTGAPRAELARRFGGAR